MKKFEKNDLFYNTIVGNPSYKIVLYNGNLTVNDQISEGNRLSSSVTFLENNFNYTCSVTEEFTKSNVFLDYEFSGTLSYNPTIKRNYIRKAGNTFDYLYTEYLTLKKILALRNVFPKYNLENTNLKISEYLEDDGVPQYKSKVFLNPLSANNYQYYIRPKKDINLIEIPQAFYGNKIQPGTLNLKIYVTGTLVAEASDKYKDTKIIQTSSSFNPSLINAEIGSILYDEGIIILTGSAQLASVSERYIQPVSSSAFNVNFSNAPMSDNLRWVHFGSHKVTTTNALFNTPIVSASFEINFQGSNQVNTLTMFCTADKNDFTWSNNRTFISGGQSDKLLLGQTSSITVNGTTHTASSNALFIPSDGKYYENDKIVVKNAISSSFSNYESKYNPQVYISEIAIYNEEGEMIGIAKLANPLRKTKDTDYTIKLKLDI
jgi:hypothetical protein